MDDVDSLLDALFVKRDERPLLFKLWSLSELFLVQIFVPFLQPLTTVDSSDVTNLIEFPAHFLN